MKKFLSKAAITPIPAEEPLSDIWYNNRQICKVLKLSLSTIYRLVKKGLLIASKQGGTVLYNHTHVEQFRRNSVNYGKKGGRLGGLGNGLKVALFLSSLDFLLFSF